MVRVLKKCFLLFDSRQKIRLLHFTILQIILNFFDLLSIFLISKIGLIILNQNLELNTSKSQINSQTRLDTTAIDFGVIDLSFKVAVSTLIFLMFTKTALTLINMRSLFSYLAKIGNQITSALLHAILNKPLSFLTSIKTQELVFATTYGLEIILLSIVASVIFIISDIVLILLLFYGLTVINLQLALGILTYFSVIGIILHHFMKRSASKLGQSRTSITIRSNTLLIDIIKSAREIKVFNRIDSFLNRYGELRFKHSLTSAKLSLLPYITKYVIETAIIFGAIIIFWINFKTSDLNYAFIGVAVFLFSASKLAPAILRIQQGVLLIKSSLSQVKPTLELSEELLSFQMEKPQYIFDLNKTPIFTPSVNIHNVSYTYPNSELPSINNVSVKIEPGKSVALVGKSGAGKSTLLDLLLGVLNPDSGYIQISGLEANKVSKVWRDKIAYLPQEIHLIEGSIRDNIMFGASKNIDDKQIWQAIKNADALDFIDKKKGGLDYWIGDGSNQLSGGEKQRIGFARAILSDPEILILDEATSSLDIESEKNLLDFITKIKNKKTIIMIAHKLELIKDFDLIILLKEGQINFQGNYNDLLEALNG